MRPNNQNVLETEVELTAQDLLAPLETHQAVEIDDIVAIETTYENPGAANSDEARSDDVLQETSEIELTAEQMDAMLEGRWPLE
jgi:hypothetical protein